MYVRERAVRDRRSISGYVLDIVLRAIDFEDSLFARYKHLTKLSGPPAERPERPRTTMLVRCSAHEARRIRVAAGRRDTTMNRYVLWTLQRAWEIADRRSVTALRAKMQELTAEELASLNQLLSRLRR